MFYFKVKPRLLINRINIKLESKMKKTFFYSLLCALLLSGCSDQEEIMDVRRAMSTEAITIDQEGTQPPKLFTVNIGSQDMYCAGLINGIMVSTNLGSSPTFSSGFNATSLLQPGKNTLHFWVAPSRPNDEKDINEYEPQDNSYMTLFEAYPSGRKRELSNLHATLDKEGKPTIATSNTYPESQRSPLINVEGTPFYDVTRFERPVYIDTIPRWRWVDATPFDPKNKEHMHQLHTAYEHLIYLMKKRDFEGLKMAWSLTSREKALAEAGYSTPDDFFDALGFEETFERYEDGRVEPHREWKEYTLESVMGGRLVRLEDKTGRSPLRINSDKKNLSYTVTPYFSFIDGRLVVVR